MLRVQHGKKFADDRFEDLGWMIEDTESGMFYRWAFASEDEAIAQVRELRQQWERDLNERLSDLRHNFVESRRLVQQRVK